MTSQQRVTQSPRPRPPQWPDRALRQAGHVLGDAAKRDAERRDPRPPGVGGGLEVQAGEQPPRGEAQRTLGGGWVRGSDQLKGPGFKAP
jgi:hypothetical protein